MSRKQVMLHGVAAEELGEIARDVPVDEPPPLPANAQLTSVGRPIDRLDAIQKVTGQARYTCDIRLPGMLYGRRVVSTVAHARITAVDTSEAETYPGVRAVHVLERTLLNAQLRDLKAEQPRYPTVRYAGQPLAGIAAETPEAADAAAQLVRVEYEALPHVTTLEGAMREDAPRVFPGPTEQPATAGGGGATPGLPQRGNIRGPDTGRLFGGPKGDVERGFAEADVVIEGEYRTQVQTHVPLETHGIVADWREDGLTIYASTQFTASVRDEAAEHFALPKSKVRVISDFTGGGFGAKYGIGNFGLLAINLSRKAGAPVRLMLDRREEHVAVGNRPSSLQRVKIGAKRDGVLTAIRLESYGSGGVAAGAGVGFCHAAMYPCPNVSTEQYDVFTNAGPCAAFRAPGQVQGIFSLEQIVDELADRLGVDPLTLRDRIDTSGTLDSAARAVERRIGAERFGWNRRRPANAASGPVKRGIGVAQTQWVSVVHPQTACEVRILGDGSVETFSAAQDIGTGTRTVLAQTVAEEFGLPATEIGAYIGDTRYPTGPPSGGSRVTGSLTPAARNAAHRAARDLAVRIARALEVPAEAIVFADGRVLVRDSRRPPLPFKDAVKKAGFEEISHRAVRNDDYDGYALQNDAFSLSRHGIGGVQFAEVTVDTETGVVKVPRILAVQDCGRPINPKLAENQVFGGIVQGVSYALYEERHLDPTSGQQVNANVDQYKIAGSLEVPNIEVVLLEQYAGISSTDARGIAEPATVCTAAAIANAFFNATGRRIRSLPMSPPHVLACLAA